MSSTLRIITGRVQHNITILSCWLKALTEWMRVWKIPCAFWTSCCPHHLNDDGASSPCVSSQSADGLTPPLPPQSASHTWNFQESYGNLQQVEKVNAERFAKSKCKKSKKQTGHQLNTAD